MSSTLRSIYNYLQSNLEPYFLPQVDAALIATGRAPFTKGLGLENVSKSRILSLWRMLCKIT